MAVQTRGAAGLCGQLRTDDDGYDHDDDDGGGCDDLFSSLALWLVFRFLSFFSFLTRVSRPLIPVITAVIS